MVAALFFYLFASVAIASAVMVISSRNPVHSVLFLILCFFNAAGLFILMGAEFLAMILVDLQDRGIRKVQAYPKLQSGLSENEAWPGPASLYQKAGFKLMAEQAGRAIWQLDLPGGALYE